VHKQVSGDRPMPNYPFLAFKLRSTVKKALLFIASSCDASVAVGLNEGNLRRL